MDMVAGSTTLSAVEPFSFLDEADSQLHSSGRRRELMEVAREKLSAVREQHRQISDAHLEARMRKERSQFDADRWATLGKRCRDSAAIVERVGDIGSYVSTKYILVASALQHSHDERSLGDRSDPLVQLRAQLEKAIGNAERDHAAARAQCLGDIESQVDTAVADRCAAAHKEELLVLQVKRVRDLLRQREDAQRAVDETNQAAHAIASSIESVARALKDVDQRIDDLRSSEQLSRNRHQVAVQLQVSLRASDPTRFLSTPSASLNDLHKFIIDGTSVDDADLSAQLSSPALGGCAGVLDDRTSNEIGSIRQIRRTVRSIQAQIAAMRTNHSAAVELELEQRRLEEAVQTRDATREAYDDLCVRQKLLETTQTACIIQAATHSTDLNIEAMGQASRGLPTLDELSNVIPALERQVGSLSKELSAARNDLFLLEDELVIARCTELKETLGMYTATVIPDRTLRLSNLRAQRLDAQRAVDAWDQEEAPRHFTYLSQLEQDKREWMIAVATAKNESDAVQAAVAAAEGVASALRARRAVLDAERSRWDAQDRGEAVRCRAEGQGDGDDAGGDEWAEIIDTHGHVCKRVRVPKGTATTFHPTAALSPPTAMDNDHSAKRHDASNRLISGGIDPSGPQEKSSVGGLRGILRLSRFHRTFIRGLFDLVRGPPIMIPGGGSVLSLDV